MLVGYGQTFDDFLRVVVRKLLGKLVGHNHIVVLQLFLRIVNRVLQRVPVEIHWNSRLFTRRQDHGEIRVRVDGLSLRGLA